MVKDRGVDPEELALCSECGEVYVGAETADGDLHAAGTDGSCENCGNDEFLIVDG